MGLLAVYIRPRTDLRLYRQAKGGLDSRLDRSNLASRSINGPKETSCPAVLYRTVPPSVPSITSKSRPSNPTYFENPQNHKFKPIPKKPLSSSRFIHLDTLSRKSSISGQKNRAAQTDLPIAEYEPQHIKPKAPISKPNPKRHATTPYALS